MQPRIPRDRPLQALVAALAQPARHPRQRHHEIGQKPPLRRQTEHVQPVADLHLLEIAEIGVEFFQRRIFRLALGDAGILVEADVGDQVEDLFLQELQPPRIAARRLVILVDQRLQVLERPVALGPRQRRRQVVDDHRAGPALGLRALARIVDDERIEMRQRPEHGLRIAGLRQSQRLARQPFEIAVLAHVDHRVDAGNLTQIGIEGEIAVRRHEIRRMIAFLRIDVVATRRLDAEEHIAEAGERQGETTVDKERITFRSAPARGHIFLKFFRKRFKELYVII
ncbi:hypothetical protein M8R20_15535 [Pseudomonas sp. R2.Fl]|nr:hypothetical protein [Pseudomonas sp. R2.Fl]